MVFLLVYLLFSVLYVQVLVPVVSVPSFTCSA